MKKILGGKDNVCPHCGGTMVYIEIEKCKVISQCKRCGCMMDGRVKDTVQIYSYEPLKNNGRCKIKSNKSQELRKQIELDFKKEKKFKYKVIAGNVVTVYKKDLSFYITKNQLEEYFDIV